MSRAPHPASEQPCRQLWTRESISGLPCVDRVALLTQIASVMGMSVSAHLLNAAYPIAISADALERDLLELEKASFLRPTDVPGTWLMTQVSVTPACSIALICCHACPPSSEEQCVCQDISGSGSHRWPTEFQACQRPGQSHAPETPLDGARSCFGSLHATLSLSAAGALVTQVLARDVAYELIPFSQRRSLHAKLAQALENDASADLVPPSTVAYHWTHSCAGSEAMHWRRALHVRVPYPIP